MQDPPFPVITTRFPAPHEWPLQSHQTNSNALDILPKCLIVGTAGSLILRAIDSDTDVSITAQAGQIIPVRASHVRAAGTTAADIVALA